jgi:SpoIID/LytB domain protein
LKLIAKNGEVIAINIVGIEDYLKSVISSEMSATASKEFLKAHSVISRSWLLNQIENKNKPSSQQQGIDSEDELIKWQDREDHELFDVCADDHCQRYQGITKIISDVVSDVIEDTWGEVLTYNGEICDARFSKCCGGRSEEYRYCWEDKSVPYLKSVRDPFCNTSDSEMLSKILPIFDQETTNFYEWSVEYTQQELSDIIKSRSGIDYGDIISLEPLERGKSGRINRLKIIGSKRTRVIGKELEIRKTLSRTHLYSSAFDVEAGAMEGGVPTSFKFSGKGWGHGVGMCQIGAAVMGERGYSYGQILSYYYPDTDLVRNYNLGDEQ